MGYCQGEDSIAIGSHDLVMLTDPGNGLQDIVELGKTILRFIQILRIAVEGRVHDRIIRKRIHQLRGKLWQADVFYFVIFVQKDCP